MPTELDPVQELIENIQNGDLTHNQILQGITTVHDQNCDEMNAAIDRIEELEGKETLNQMVILELKDKLDKAVAKCKEQKKSIDIISKEGLKAVDYAQSLEQKLVVKETQLKEFNRVKAELKKMKPRVKRLAEANAAHQKHRKASKLKYNQTKKELQTMCIENAKLRMTGHKQVGKYNFTIFPVKVNTETEERKIGLTVYNQEGAMKILTRHSETGEIVQPKSHNFRFNQTEEEWINGFFDVCDAHDHRFDDNVLRLVK